MKRAGIFGMVVMILMALFCGGVSMAQMPGKGPGMIPLRVLMELDLTDAQKAEIAAILEASKTEMDSAKQKRDEVKEILAPVMTADTFDEENLRSAFAKASPIVEDVMVIKAKIGSQIKSVLTAEQKQILDEKRQEGMEKMEKFKKFQETMLETWLNQKAAE